MQAKSLTRSAQLILIEYTVPPVTGKNQFLTKQWCHSWAVGILLDFKALLPVEININGYNWAEIQDHLDGG